MNTGRAHSASGVRRRPGAALPALALLAAVLLAAPPARGLDRSGWAFRAPVVLSPDRTSAPLVELALPPAVLAVAAPGLADLRVVTEDGREVPWVRATRDGDEGRAPLSVSLSDRAWVPGVSASVVVDFGPERPERAVIEVVTAGTDFRRRVRVEARDAPNEPWQVLREGALLFRAAPVAGSGGYDRSRVALPPGRQRWLRVTVETGHGDPLHLDIEAVRAWREVAQPPETAPVTVRETRVTRAPDGRATWVDLDLGQPGLPLDSVTVQAADPDFFRSVTVLGRHAAAATDAWEPVGSGALFRLTTGGPREESLTLPLHGASFRHLRLRIEDGDDAPLALEGASVARRVPRIAFRPAPGQPHDVLVGNPHADPPDYDLPRFAERLRSAGVAAAAVGPLVPNPAFGAQPADVPWSERRRGLLWAALLLALAVLGLLVWRQLRHARAAAGPRPAAGAREGDAPRG